MIKRLFLLFVLFVTALLAGGCQGANGNNGIDRPALSPLPMPDAPLTMLYFSQRASYNKRVQGCAFRAEDDGETAYFYMANEDEPYPVPVDRAWVDELTGFIRQYDLLSWNGFRSEAGHLLDGTQFTLRITFADGASVGADGYGKLPPRYGEASSAIEAHFMQLLPVEMRDW